MTNPSKNELKAGLAATVAVAEAIREAGELPAGNLYAVLMGRLDIQAFDKLIGILTGSGLVEKRGDLLRWVGPAIARS